MFSGKNKKLQVITGNSDGAARLLVLTEDNQSGQKLNLESVLASALADASALDIKTISEFNDDRSLQSRFILSLFNEPGTLDQLADTVLEARSTDPKITLIVAIRPDQLLALGRWLENRAKANQLGGIRLILEENVEAVSRSLGKRLKPVLEDNVIRMPVSTEIENSEFRNFYVFSPEIQNLISQIRAFAENGVNRVYLLGGPGSGKTSLAYYYYLARQQGRFVSVNLAAENTGDKAAVKSLLCGHVTGAFPGAGARSGAFRMADDGVCFIDESHDVLGPVMEVLMEALDNNQYMPLGAAAKQPIRCSILFATNRSWEHLQQSLNLDEFARIGAATLQVPELHQREEDMIALVASVLCKLAKPCKTWIPPQGLAPAAWDVIRECRWHGNVRALIRCLEAAFLETVTGSSSKLIPVTAVNKGIALWEPETHHSHEIYAAYNA